MGNREMWVLRRVRLGNGGYEVGTAHYFGYDRANHVYRATRESDSYTMEFRATTRSGAKSYVRQSHPHAQFHN